ncbi:MAG TPA: TonB family protein [Frateuria sp.]|uniref:TonB family protein n=1 Tax=Frateuria sp. TaxID=2211372 RepID=UPI002D80B906|nr:TonB family protein [Frateuria sp.]HET6805912.1 TonB family protein [Frateuria sp.]
MSATVRRPDTPDPIGATFLFSLLLHGVLVLGLTFHFARPRPSLPTLDVTLVDVANRDAPDKADFLAQANNRGGGNSDEVGRPTERLSGLLPVPGEGVAPLPREQQRLQAQDATPDRLITTIGRSRRKVASDTADKARPEPDQPPSKLEQLRQEAARLTAERDRRVQRYAKRPIKKFLSANTAEGMYAAYLHGWFKRVERVGNLNYPEQARRQHIHGDLEVSVGLNRDGSIADIQIIRSSGSTVLDNAAKRIVHLSAPFPPWPQDKQGTTILYIDRVWEFGVDDTLRHR